jgi:hypothetical protein
METLLILAGVMLLGIIGTIIQIEAAKRKEEKVLIKIFEEISDN